MPLAIIRCSLLTPLDRPARSTWDALLAGARVESGSAVDDALIDEDKSLDRSIRLALSAARGALAGLKAQDTALFCGTSKGPVGTMLEVLKGLRNKMPPTDAQARQIALGVGAMGAIVAERLGLAAGHTSVAACSSGLHALHRAAQALRRGECGRALVVAADASLHPLFEASFERLGVLAPRDEGGVRRCEPFATEGRGFFVSEAAAAILLENRPASGSRTPAIEDNPIAWLDHSWIGADSTALIAIDPATEALRRGLAACGADASLAFIHAHATGTDHDRHELEAIRSAVGSDIPVFSHKAWLGHSLGAAGLVSVALSALCHRHEMLPTGKRIGRQAHSLTIGQGFGGHIALARLRGA